ncbi:MAG: T9SS type A sorting domain-containing protein, partial [Leadbetterella sp.]|nr:T9SS type A sorting domain-containing protein [Leadbetterella sp.]
LQESWAGDAWSNVSYALYYYDEFGNLISIVIQVWEIDTWVNSVQITFTYDGNNNMATAVYQIWQNEDWLNSNKELYSYNAANHPIEITGQIWGETDWVNSNKTTYTYNEYDFIVLALDEIWENGSWVYNQKASFTQNFYGGIQSVLIENWINGAWVNFSLTTYSHDDVGNALTADLFSWDGDTWIQDHDGNLELIYYYNINSDTFYGYHAEASYISIITGLREIKNDNIAVFTAYPNPSNGLISLLVTMKDEAEAEISLFNLTGNEILKVHQGWLHKGENKFSLTANFLPSGMYIAKITLGNQSKYLKIVKLNN